MISLFTQLSTNSVSLLVKSPDNQTPYKLKETNTPSSSGLLHAGFSPPLLLTEQGGGTSVLRSRTAEGGRAGEICSPTLSIFFQSTPTSEAYFETKLSKKPSPAKRLYTKQVQGSKVDQMVRKVKWHRMTFIIV